MRLEKGSSRFRVVRFAASQARPACTKSDHTNGRRAQEYLCALPGKCLYAGPDIGRWALATKCQCALDGQRSIAPRWPVIRSPGSAPRAARPTPHRGAGSVARSRRALQDSCQVLRDEPLLPRVRVGLPLAIRPGLESRNTDRIDRIRSGADYTRLPRRPSGDAHCSPRPEHCERCGMRQRYSMVRAIGRRSVQVIALHSRRKSWRY